MSTVSKGARSNIYFGLLSVLDDLDDFVGRPLGLMAERGVAEGYLLLVLHQLHHVLGFFEG